MNEIIKGVVIDDEEVGEHNDRAAIVLSKVLPGITRVKEQWRYDVPDCIEFYHSEWAYQGHKIEVNGDQYGYHARIDGGACKPNMDEDGLISFMVMKFKGFIYMSHLSKL